MQELLITKERKSNFELLRIIAIVLIIMHHFSLHGNYVISNLSISQYLIDFFMLGGKVGVNLFILISGYFLVNAKFKPKKLVKLICLIVFYSVSIYLVQVCVTPGSFNMLTLLKSAFPVSNYAYWFVTCYVFMYGLSFFLNKIINVLDQKEYIILISILLFIQMFLMPFLSTDIVGPLCWFLTLYLVAAYIRIYGNKWLNKQWLMVLLFIGTYMGMFVIYSFLDIPLYGMNHVPTVIASITLFCIFKNLDIKSNKFINYLASLSFAVYLIHDNNIVRGWMWAQVNKLPTAINLLQYLLYVIGCILAIYIGCVIIEILRKLILRLMGYIYDKHKDNKLKNKGNAIIKVCDKNE